MRCYRVPPDLFAAQFPDYDHDRHRLAIGELIDRYDIRNKRVLALGSASAFEERWFVELGDNELTIIDIDEHGSAEQMLQSAPPGRMRYIVGDALVVDPGPHDVLYASGFTPDERRRRSLITVDHGSYMEFWRFWWGPFHPGLIAHARRLSPGGLMIVQSIGYSLDVDDHWQYVPACRLQLALNGLRLLEVWRFVETTGVMLYVAQKRGGRRPSMKSPLTMFHARAAAREPIERIYPKP
jgi:hypothetical protein